MEEVEVLASVPSEPGQLETNMGLLCLSGHGAYLPSTSTHTASNTACVAATAFAP